MKDADRRPRLAFLGAALALILTVPTLNAQTSGSAPGSILLLYSVGGALTSDGTLWQYRPDLRKWMTIDEAFNEQGRKTHVLPLPVRPDSIAEMSTFGFFRTRRNDLWLYDIERDKWQRLPPPNRR